MIVLNLCDRTGRNPLPFLSNTSRYYFFVILTLKIEITLRLILACPSRVVCCVLALKAMVGYSFLKTGKKSINEIKIQIVKITKNYK